MISVIEALDDLGEISFPCGAIEALDDLSIFVAKLFLSLALSLSLSLARGRKRFEGKMNL